MIGVIHDNIEELQKVTDMRKEIESAKDYYDLNDFQWALACTWLKVDIFNMLIWLYEHAYWFDDTVFEFSTHLYNKYFPNKPKYPKMEHASRKSTFIEIEEDEINAAF